MHVCVKLNLICLTYQVPSYPDEKLSSYFVLFCFLTDDPRNPIPKTSLWKRKASISFCCLLFLFYSSSVHVLLMVQSGFPSANSALQMHSVMPLVPGLQILQCFPHLHHCEHEIGKRALNF